MTAPGGVEVWEAEQGSWRWRYVEPPPGQPDAGRAADLPSHKDYPSREAAVAAARTAYPDVPVDVAVPSPPPPLVVRGSGCRRTAVRGGVSALLLAVAVVAVVRRQRRAGRGPRRTLSS